MLGACAVSHPRREPEASHTAAQGVKRGDRVWQIAFGSGFKCNSAVWRARRAISTKHEAWLDRPHPGYPATPEVYA